MSERDFGGIPCPECGAKTQVLDSRPTHLGDGAVAIRRRRKCIVNPRHRHTTYEFVADESLTTGNALRALARGVIYEELRKLADHFEPESKREMQAHIARVEQVIGGVRPTIRTTTISEDERCPR